MLDIYSTSRMTTAPPSHRSILAPTCDVSRTAFAVLETWPLTADWTVHPLILHCSLAGEIESQVERGKALTA